MERDDADDADDAEELGGREVGVDDRDEDRHELARDDEDVEPVGIVAGEVAEAVLAVALGISMLPSAYVPGSVTRGAGSGKGATSSIERHAALMTASRDRERLVRVRCKRE